MIGGPLKPDAKSSQGAASASASLFGKLEFSLHSLDDGR
jgi:hypothetical protein